MWQIIALIHQAKTTHQATINQMEQHKTIQEQTPQIAQQQQANQQKQD